MTDWAALENFLDTDPADVGCEQAMDILHVYADLVAAGTDAASRYRGVAAHLAACGPCGEDFRGLLAAITASPDRADGDRHRRARPGAAMVRRLTPARRVRW